MLVAFLAVGTAHAQSILISSNSGSAIAGLYSNQTYSYNFGITTLGGGQSLQLTNIGIYMDRGNNTTQPFQVSIYGGLGATGPLLTNFTVAATNVSTTMSLFNLLFQGSLSLTNGNYSLTLSSSAASGGSTQYSLRQGTLALVDSNNAPLPLTYWVQDSNTSGSAGTNFQANFVLADYKITTTNINYGNYRIGANLTTSVTLTNTAIYATNASGGIVSENLATTTATTNAATVSSLSTNLVSVNQTKNFNVGMSSVNVGSNSGVVTLTYNSVSNGTASVRPTSLGTNPVGIGSQQITVTGVGYRLATNAVSTTNVSLGNYRLGASNVTASLGLTNTATNDGFSEGLGVSNSATTGGATVGGIPGGLIAAGGNTNITVGLSSISTAGTNSGTLTLGFNSSGVGTSGFSATNIGSKVVNISAVGYRLAQDAVSTTNIQLGRFHVGYTTNNGALSGQVGITNTATADSFSEGLAVTTNGTTGGATVSGIPATVIAAGTNKSVTVGLGSISTVGANIGTVTLGFQSSGVGTSGLAATNIGSKVVNVSAQGYSGRAFWSTDAGGSWNNFDNWDVPGGTPGIDGVLSTNDTATFGDAISSARTVSLNGQNPVLAALNFSNANSSYTLEQGSGGAITLGTTLATGVITNSAGNHTVSSAIALARATTIGVATSSKLNLSTVNGTNAIAKTGEGILSITGSGNLSGTTTVSSGTLNVNGSISNSSVIVQDGAYLTGSGSVGTTVIQGGAIHSPGNSPGVQTVVGNLTYESAATVLWELIANSTEGRGSNYDGIDVTGNLAFNGPTTLSISFNTTNSVVNWSDSFWSTNKLGVNGWLVFKVDGSVTGFENLTLSGLMLDSLGQSLSSQRDGASFDLTQVDNDIYLTYTVVPEPSTYALLALAAAGLGLHLIRRRRSTR